MRHDPYNDPLPPELAALEESLAKMRPRAVRTGLCEEILEPLAHEEDGIDMALLESGLAQRLSPSKVPDSVWEGIASKMGTTPTVSETDERVVTVPQWRDFTPIFKAAAVVAAGVLAISAWNGSKDERAPVAEASLEPAGVVPVASAGNLDPEAIRPVSQRGTILWQEREGITRSDDGVYETERQRRKDRWLYHLDGVRVEDEVQREGTVLKRLRTF